MPQGAKASVYSNPAYHLPPYTCTTGIGCCRATQLPNLIHQMFSGTGLYANRKDLEQDYYLKDLSPKIIAAFKRLADEVRNARVYAAAQRGAFIDAQNFNYTQTSLGKSATESLIKSTPSDQICRFGTLAKSLAQSDDKAKVVQLGLASQMLQRELLHKGLAAGTEKEVGTELGRTSDKLARLEQYKQNFCDPQNSNGTLGSEWCSAPMDDRYNRDINVTRSLMTPLTLGLNFSTDSVDTKTKDEENIIALSNNLFAHNLPLNIGESEFKAISSGDGDKANQQKERLMDYRALTAKRTVAQNSFAALAAMKAEGSGASSVYVKQMIEYLGLKSDAHNNYIGEKPSYHAQMELLTRKIYQSPEFYANLMDSPANVARQQAAMEGIALMQDRDIHNSLRRSEMVLSTLLEMYISAESDNNKDRGIK